MLIFFIQFTSFSKNSITANQSYVRANFIPGTNAQPNSCALKYGLLCKCFSCFLFPQVLWTDNLTIMCSMVISWKVSPTPRPQVPSSTQSKSKKRSKTSKSTSKSSKNAKKNKKNKNDKKKKRNKKEDKEDKDKKKTKNKRKKKRIKEELVWIRSLHSCVFGDLTEKFWWSWCCT